MTRPMFVYVVEAENGMIKIGCSADPETRARGICANSPIRVRLIAALPGDRRAESAYHRQFVASCGWSEWFLPTEEIQRFVGLVRGTGIGPIVAWERVLPKADPERTNKLRSESMKRTWSDPETRANWFSIKKRAAASPPAIAVE